MPNFHAFADGMYQSTHTKEPGDEANLLYRLNCHIDKQPVVWDSFFAGVWIAGNSRQGEQITFQALSFSNHEENANNYLSCGMTNNTHTHT